MKAKSVCTVSKARKVVVVVWFSSFILAVPTLIVQVHIEVGLVQKAFWCIRDDSSPNLWRAGEIYFLLVLLLIPGGFMSAAYGVIAREICKCMKERKNLLAATQSGGGGGGGGTIRRVSVCTGGQEETDETEEGRTL